MTESELIELKNEIDNLVYASTKKEAKPLYNKLKFKASHLNEEINPYLLGKLNEAILHAHEASGQIANKEHWMMCMERSWQIFKSGVQN